MHGELSAYPLPFKLYFGIFQGDSGAPLTHESNHGQNILIGFFSWALGCARVTLNFILHTKYLFIIILFSLGRNLWRVYKSFPLQSLDRREDDRSKVLFWRGRCMEDRVKDSVAITIWIYSLLFLIGLHIGSGCCD